MKKIFYLISIFFSMSTMLHAMTDEEKGYAINHEVDRRDSGFGDSTHDALMILRNTQGDESKREFTYKTLEITGSIDQKLAKRKNHRLRCLFIRSCVFLLAIGDNRTGNSANSFNVDPFQHTLGLSTYPPVKSGCNSMCQWMKKPHGVVTRYPGSYLE